MYKNSAEYYIKRAFYRSNRISRISLQTVLITSIAKHLLRRITRFFASCVSPRPYTAACKRANTHVRRPRRDTARGGCPVRLRPCLVIEHARFLPHCSRIPFTLENRLHCAPRHCLLTPPFKADKIYRGMSRTKRYFRWLPPPLPFCPSKRVVDVSLQHSRIFLVDLSFPQSLPWSP